VQGGKGGIKLRFMKYITMGLLMALTVSGCIDDDGRGYGGRRIHTDCSKFTACRGCTLALGCGWCSSGPDGICVSEPNVCAGATTFSWTWEASGCPGAVDAGPTPDGTTPDGWTPIDGAADTGFFPPPAAPPPEAVDAAATDAGVTDAADGG
jgi:Plexin repeat